MGSLWDVAREYDREAMRALSPAKIRNLRAMADSLRYIASNRDAADPAVLRLHLGLRPDLPSDWCRRHGYEATVGFDGLTFGREGEPVQIASFGDVLHWDGENISIERGA
jgi:hypothetical protein